MAGAKDSWFPSVPLLDETETGVEFPAVWVYETCVDKISKSAKQDRASDIQSGLLGLRPLLQGNSVILIIHREVELVFYLPYPLLFCP